MSLGLHGNGARVMVDSPDVPAISFHGKFAYRSGDVRVRRRNLKRFGLELGADSCILFERRDLDKALPAVEKALTVFAGQFCMTGSRLLVHRPILTPVRERLANRLEAVKVGPAADAPHDGSDDHLAAVKRVEDYGRGGDRQGAKIVVRGGPFKQGPLAKVLSIAALLEIPIIPCNRAG